MKKAFNFAAVKYFYSLMLIIRNFREFDVYSGKDLGYSQWHTISQEQVNSFGKATLDEQWIHTDPVRAEAESPFKCAIVHGYLTLSLVPGLLKDIVDIQNVKMQINYGVNNLKFAQAVPVNSKVRLKVALASILNLRGVTKATFAVIMEIEGEKKPAFTAEAVFLYHFID